MAWHLELLIEQQASELLHLVAFISLPTVTITLFDGHDR